jgi:hypothetical protein
MKLLENLNFIGTPTEYRSPVAGLKVLSLTIRGPGQTFKELLEYLYDVDCRFRLSPKEDVLLLRL